MHIEILLCSKFFRNTLAILILLLPACTLGQANLFTGQTVLKDSDVGIVSYIDTTINPTCITGISQPSDATTCLPHIEVIDLSRYQACIDTGNFSTCPHKSEYVVPYITETIANKILEDINKAFGEYYDEVIDIYNSELWKVPYAVNAFGMCPEPFDLTALAERQARAYAKVLAEAQPKYWAKVYQVVLTNSPAALHYSVPYPLGKGIIFSPIMADMPQIDQYYRELVANPATNTLDYLRRLGYISELNQPFLPNEIALDAGGLFEIEEDKRALDMATVKEQEQYGFANLFAIYNNPEFQMHFNVFRGPYAPGFCWACSNPLICVPLVPVPSVVPMPALIYPTPRARPKYVSVPEGYSIPDVKADPILNPLN